MERLAGQVLISIVCGLQPDRFVGSNRALARQARACSAVCSNPAEEWLESGRSRRPASEFRAENKLFALVWTRVLTVRDREAPGSNPGPPTIFVFKIGDFQCSLESALHGRITISCRATKPARCNRVRRGQCE